MSDSAEFHAVPRGQHVGCLSLRGVHTRQSIVCLRLWASATGHTMRMAVGTKRAAQEAKTRRARPGNAAKRGNLASNRLTARSTPTRTNNVILLSCEIWNIKVIVKCRTMRFRKSISVLTVISAFADSLQARLWPHDASARARRPPYAASQ